MLGEAIYDSPYYWMRGDPVYLPKADENRGWFTEEFCKQRLESVFGPENIYRDVKLMQTKEKTLTDIDVLAVFANRIIIIQAKSKKLTIEARKGNDGLIRKDFSDGIQNAYNQGLTAAKAIQDSSVDIVSPDGRQIKFSDGIKEIYIICTTSENYPSLNFQVQQFLKYSTDDIIQKPLVFDIFTIDAITEMLDTPLRFLSYINKRANYSEIFLATHELIVLSYHLRKNLWAEPNVSMVMLEDDIGIELELAMMVRRDGVKGNGLPEGILTRISKTTVGRLIEQIESWPVSGTIELGMLLLTLNEQTIRDISSLIDRILAMTRRDRQPHDFTFGIDMAKTGMTVYSAESPDRKVLEKLENHCKLKKYQLKANSWYGLCLSSNNSAPVGGIYLESDWKPNEELEKVLKDYTPKKPLQLIDIIGKKPRVGRNDLCPCGSGKKFKKCCL